MSDRSCYIVAHEGYKAHLWGDDYMPDIVRQLPPHVRRLVCIAHNKDIGTAWAKMHRDIQLITGINDTLCRDITELRKVKDRLDEKLRRQSDTVRKQSEKLKTMKELSA